MAHKDITREELDERLNEYLGGDLVDFDVFKLGDKLVSIEGSQYEIIEDATNTFDPVLFKQRYTDLFEKFDYIVGDMAYDKLRLRGFYEESVEDVPVDMHISSLEDYLVEYCNFGVKYYVLKRLDEKTVFPDYRKKKNKNRKQNRKRNTNQPKNKQKKKFNKKPTNKNNKKPHRSKQSNKYKSERKFEIQKKDD